MPQTLYLGVEDDGTVQGLRLTRGHRDAIRLAVDKAVSSFRYLSIGRKCFLYVNYSSYVDPDTFEGQHF